MEKTDINRRLHETLGKCWHEHRPDRYHSDACICGACWMGGCPPNPDYAADARLVIEAMREREDFHRFIAKINALSLDEDGDLIDNCIPIDLIMDKTGRLALLAIEWLGKQEGMNQKEWYERAINKGTSGDMVFAILRDWDAELAALQAELQSTQIDAGKLFREKDYKIGELQVRLKELEALTDAAYKVSGMRWKRYDAERQDHAITKAILAEKDKEIAELKICRDHWKISYEQLRGEPDEPKNPRS